MKLIGLTGGIGSGKTTVAHFLAEHGALIIDADRIAREIVEPPSPVLAELAAEFGDDILTPEGTLNRALLASRAFVNEERTAALNSIMHPRIRQETHRRIQAARQSGEAVAVYDMPLLVDLGLHEEMDIVVVVDADEQTRVDRLVAQRGLSADDAWARIRQQISDSQRRAAADIIVDNNGDREELAEQLQQLVAALHERGVALGG